MFMRVAILADTQADEANRWSEYTRIMDWIATDMRERQVDLVLHGGDVFQGQSTSLEREAVDDWVRRVADCAPLVVVAGNHDDPRDVLSLAKLAAHHPVRAAARPRVVYAKSGCAVLCLPWPTRTGLLAWAAPGAPPESREATALGCLSSVLAGLAAEVPCDYPGPRILLAHLMPEGSLTDHDQPLIGRALSVPPAALAIACADLYVCGHVHLHQVVRPVGAPPIVIPGAPYHRTFGESAPNKGYVVAEFEQDRAPRWEFVKTPATPMLLVDARWEPRNVVPYEPSLEDHVFVRPASVPGGAVAEAEVRLRYTVAAERRLAAKRIANELAAAWRANGAVSVALDEVVQTAVTARAPEVAQARTLPDQLRAFWSTRSDAPSPERQRRLLVRLAELDAAEAGT